MKFRKGFFSVVVIILAICSFGVRNSYAVSEKVYLGGMTAGFSLFTKGAAVIGLCDVITDDGINSPSKVAGIEVGDVILSIDGQEVNSAQDIEKVVKNKELKIKIERNGEITEKMLVPAKDVNGKLKLGVFIRDCINGIGTVTYLKDGKIASLGHPVISDNGEILQIVKGSMFSCYITNVIKGERGKAGELRGVFDRTCEMAKIEKNCISGVYGSIVKDGFDTSSLKEVFVGEAKAGEASIFSTVNGNEICEYSILIVKVDSENGENKNFVIKVTDKKLIERTGGIVQGMSGSPIVQNGKLVGAVTHVFINDPTRGFGLSINKMINE